MDTTIKNTLFIFLFLFISSSLLSQKEQLVVNSGAYLIGGPDLRDHKTDIFIKPGEIVEKGSEECSKYLYSVTYKGIRGFIDAGDVYPIKSCKDDYEIVCSNNSGSLFNDRSWQDRVLLKNKIIDVSINNIRTLIPKLYESKSNKIDCHVIQVMFSAYINTVRECNEEHSWWILSIQKDNFSTDGNRSLLFLMNNGSWDDVYYVTINKCGEIQNMFLILRDVIENYDTFELESRFIDDKAELIYNYPNGSHFGDISHTVGYHINDCGVFTKIDSKELDVSIELGKNMYNNGRYNFSISYPRYILFRGIESLNGDGIKFYNNEYDQIGLVSGRQMLNEVLTDKDVMEKHGVSYNLMSKESFNQQLLLEDKGFEVVDHITKKDLFVIKAVKDNRYYYQYTILTKGISGDWCLADLKLDYDESMKSKVTRIIPELTFSFKSTYK